MFARVNGVLLNYRLVGPAGAPVIVLVNSLGTDARIWDAVIDDLTPEYRVLSYDKRGHGLSDAPPAPYTISEHTKDLEGLLAHLRIDRFALCGVSVGGVIAQRFALDHADRVAALILCDTAARIGAAEFWNARIEAVTTRGIPAISDAILERWFTPAYRRDQPDQFAGWRNMLERSPVAGYAGTCAALRDADLRSEIGAIALRPLVVVGSDDLSTPPDLVRETAALVPGSRFEIITGAGHLPCIEQPAKFVALLREHLKEKHFA